MSYSLQDRSKVWYLLPSCCSLLRQSDEKSSSSIHSLMKDSFGSVFFNNSHHPTPSYCSLLTPSVPKNWRHSFSGCVLCYWLACWISLSLRHSSGSFVGSLGLCRNNRLTANFLRISESDVKLALMHICTLTTQNQLTCSSVRVTKDPVCRIQRHLMLFFLFIRIHL